jgi:hypothetical protein
VRRRQVGQRCAVQLRSFGARSRLGLGAILAMALGLAAMVFTDPAAAGPTALPDGRAYEMVSPPEKGANDAEPRTFPAAPGIAGEDESGFVFWTLNGLPGSEGAPLLVANVAKRGTGGWSTSPISPPELNQASIQTGQTVMFSNDLDQALVASKVPLAAGAPAGVNLYLRRIGEPGFELVTKTAIPPVFLEGTELNYNTNNAVGASKDFGHVFFHANVPLTAESPQSTVEELYEFSNGTLRDVGILPGETAPFEGTVNSYPPVQRPVSEDGSQVLFGAVPPGEGLPQEQLYLRKDDAQTIDISEPEEGVEDPGGPQQAILAGASASGASVYFTSASTLTADANTGEEPGGRTDLAPNLYRYDAATGRLTDLTIAEPVENPTTEPELGADVKSALVSPSGEGVFFVAGGIFDHEGTRGADNLFHWSQAEGTTFITTVEPSDAIVTNSGAPEAATDAAGDAIAFVSTGGEAAPGVPEIYRWSVAGGLACASCGSGPVGAGAHLPTPGVALGSGGGHPISADGSKVFFSTTDALVPQDSNGKEDVYEWEGGADHLLSSGTGNSGSYFVDASPSGKDVFFATRDRLVPADQDENLDVYDAREGGGFPAAQPPAAPCEAEACRPPLSAAPAMPGLASRAFQGPGNKKQKHHKKKHRKHAKHKARKCTAKSKRCSRQRKHKAHSGGKRG